MAALRGFTFRAEAIPCRKLHLTKSSMPPGVVYRNLPATFMVSWSGRTQEESSSCPLHLQCYGQMAGSSLRLTPIEDVEGAPLLGCLSLQALEEVQDADFIAASV